MTTMTRPSDTETRFPVTGRRIGYVIAIVVNAVLLYVVNNLLAWDLVPFLTDDFRKVLPIINISLIATLVVNIAYLTYDPVWFKAACQAGVGAISVAASVLLYQVFPFDFTPYDFAWSTVARVVLIIAIVGSAIGVVVEVAKLARYAVKQA